MFYFLVFRLCLGQTIEKTIYLQEYEYYQQGLYELFSDTIDHNYSFIDSSKGFHIRDSNLKQEQSGKYTISPTNIITQKQFKNLEDYQGNQQYGVLFNDDNDKYQLCYNSNIQNLDIDFCIQLNNNYHGYDFIFLNYNTVAISSIQNNQFQVQIYQGDNLISQLSFQPSVQYQSLKSTKIDMMVYNNQKYLFVVGMYPTDQGIIPIDVLIIQSDYSIIQSYYPLGFIDKVFDIKGIDNGTVFIQVSYNAEKVINQIQLQNDKWVQQSQYQQQNNIGFDLGYSTIDGTSFRSLIQVSDTNYQLQSQDNKTQIQNQYQKVIKQDSIFKFTKNYLIFLQYNQLIISNFKNNIQRINQFPSQILSIDVDFQTDKLIVFTTSEIIKFQLQDIYLAYQGQMKTDYLEIVTITNGLTQLQINFRVLESSDNNLYQLTTEVNNIYFNLMYSPGPFKIPIPVSGIDPTLQIFTDKQLDIVAEKYQVTDAVLDKEIPLYSQILVTNGITSVFKQYEDFRFIIYQCDQYFRNFDCYHDFQYNANYNEQVKLYTQQQGDYQGYLILSNNQIDIYANRYQQFKIKDIENITDVVVTDKIFVVYQTLIKVYTYPNAIEIYKLDIQQLNIDNPIKIWANNLYNNYLFILSQTGQLVIGQFTNRFYLTQIIQFATIKIDLSIVTNDKIILSQQNNNDIIDVSVYDLDNGLIVKQYSLDLHNYTIKNYILQKDYINGKIGIFAELDNQNVLLLYGFSLLQRDQLQKIIYLDKDQDFDHISLCGNSDQTHMILTKNKQSNYQLIYAYYEAQYVQVSVQTEYLTNLFSQVFPITYIYSNNEQKNITLQNQIFYEYNFYTVSCKSEMINILYNSNQKQFEYELPKDLFSGQIQYIYTTTSNQIQLETKVKNRSEVKAFGYMPQCKHVIKYNRILCISKEPFLNYNKYNGELIQQVVLFEISTNIEVNLIVSIDNSKAILFQKTQFYLISLSENSFQLYQGETSINLSFENILFYKDWIINYQNDKLQFYYLSADQQWRIEQKYQLYVPDIGKFDYHPSFESIYYTQHNSILTILKCSLESDSISIDSIKTFDIQGYLFKQKIYTIDLKLNYLKIFDNNIVITSNYGHIYTFDIDKLELINIYIITGPQAYVQDINIFDRYLIMKGKYGIFLYENKNGWNINNPYLSLEPIYDLMYVDCIALYKDDQDFINILMGASNYYIQNFIIDDKYILKFSNLSEQTPYTYYIVGGNPYNYSFSTINSIYQEEKNNSSIVWIILVSILGVIIIIGILGYFYKKMIQSQNNQRAHDLFIN